MRTGPAKTLPFPSRGLYAVTADGHPDSDTLVTAVRAAIAGGAAVIQYRCKSARERSRTAGLLLAECRGAGVPLIINDDVELALAIGADGVHLGKDDGEVAETRTRLGAQAIVGVSCYDSLDRALQAQYQGASYVAFGRFFPSRSKPHAACARLETLVEARRLISVPIVAIGGITPENGGPLIDAGASVLAVIDSVFGDKAPETAARRFQPLFPKG